MLTKTRRAAIAAVAATGMLVAMPTAAHAYSSGSGTSYLVFDDAANQLHVCDGRYNDGIGAIGTLRNSGAERISYNGCDTFYNVLDGTRIDAQICDWEHINGDRRRTNCAYYTIWA